MFFDIFKTFCHYGLRHNIATLQYEIILPYLFWVNENLK
jgi:hypothetical protein